MWTLHHPTQHQQHGYYPSPLGGNTAQCCWGRAWETIQCGHNSVLLALHNRQHTLSQANAPLSIASVLGFPRHQETCFLSGQGTTLHLPTRTTGQRKFKIGIVECQHFFYWEKAFVQGTIKHLKLIAKRSFQQRPSPLWSTVAGDEHCYKGHSDIESHCAKVFNQISVTHIPNSIKLNEIQTSIPLFIKFIIIFIFII